MNVPEIIIKYFSYKPDPGKNTRSRQVFMGSIDQIEFLFESMPLDDYQIIFIDIDSLIREPDKLLRLSKSINNSLELGKPFANCMY